MALILLCARAPTRRVAELGAHDDVPRRPGVPLEVARQQQSRHAALQGLRSLQKLAADAVENRVDARHRLTGHASPSAQCLPSQRHPGQRERHRPESDDRRESHGARQDQPARRQHAASRGVSGARRPPGRRPGPRSRADIEADRAWASAMKPSRGCPTHQLSVLAGGVTGVPYSRASGRWLAGVTRMAWAPLGRG